MRETRPDVLADITPSEALAHGPLELRLGDLGVIGGVDVADARAVKEAVRFGALQNRRLLPPIALLRLVPTRERLGREVLSHPHPVDCLEECGVAPVDADRDRLLELELARFGLREGGLLLLESRPRDEPRRGDRHAESAR